jgi:hypothetical protein
MLVEIKIKSENSEIFEILNLSGDLLKDILKNNPQKLLQIIEDIEKNFPTPIGGKPNNKENDSYLMMATASCSAF